MFDDVRSELKELRKTSNGKLYPEKVIDFARNQRTKLHSLFEWDDNEAAKQYRIYQAHSIIRKDAIKYTSLSIDDLPAYFHTATFTLKGTSPLVVRRFDRTFRLTETI